MTDFHGKRHRVSIHTPLPAIVRYFSSTNGIVQKHPLPLITHTTAEHRCVKLDDSNTVCFMSKYDITATTTTNRVNF